MNPARHFLRIALEVIIFCTCMSIQAQVLIYDNLPVRVEIRESGMGSIRISITPEGMAAGIHSTPGLADRVYPEPTIYLTEVDSIFKAKTAGFDITIVADPLRIAVNNSDGRSVQELGFMEDGRVSFILDDKPILGMGEGGPRMGRRWRNDTIEFDRRGRLHRMEPRWQANAYGSRNPVAMLVGTGGWGLFVASPWVQVDLTDDKRGVFIPRRLLGIEAEVQNRENQQQNSGKGHCTRSV
jgi:hypothetical protein